jgi:hypothetical protein
MAGGAGSALRAGGRLACCAALACVALGLGGAGLASADTLYLTTDLLADEAPACVVSRSERTARWFRRRGCPERDVVGVGGARRP